MTKKSDQKIASRRKFLMTAGATAAATVTMPQISRAQTATLRMQTSWPATDIFTEMAQQYVERVNSMAGVAQAYGAASPMVHLGGAVPLKADMEAFHGVDDPAFVHEMFKKITKWSARVERIDDIPEVMAKAFHIARSGRPGPVHVELPRVSDYSEYILQETPAVLPAYQRIPATVVKPDPAFVDQCAQRLMAARAPLLAAGKGVIRQGAIGLLTKLAEKLQAPVITAQPKIAA